MTNTNESLGSVSTAGLIKMITEHPVDTQLLCAVQKDIKNNREISDIGRNALRTYFKGDIPLSMFESQRIRQVIRAITELERRVKANENIGTAAVHVLKMIGAEPPQGKKPILGDSDPTIRAKARAVVEMYERASDKGSFETKIRSPIRLHVLQPRAPSRPTTVS